MACSISANSRPMLRTIASVLSRGVAWGGFCMASTLLAKTVCPAPDQLGRRKGLNRLGALDPGVVMAAQADPGWADHHGFHNAVSEQFLNRANVSWLNL